MNTTMNAMEARRYLEQYDCTVFLHISNRAYQTHAGVNDKEQIFIEGLEYTHIHNISAIKVGDKIINVNWYDPVIL